MFSQIVNPEEAGNESLNEVASAMAYSVFPINGRVKIIQQIIKSRKSNTGILDTLEAAVKQGDFSDKIRAKLLKKIKKKRK